MYLLLPLLNDSRQWHILWQKADENDYYDNGNMPILEMGPFIVKHLEYF